MRVCVSTFGSSQSTNRLPLATYDYNRAINNADIVAALATPACVYYTILLYMGDLQVTHDVIVLGGVAMIDADVTYKTTSSSLLTSA